MNWLEPPAEDIVVAYEAGMTIKEVGSQFGCSYTEVRTLLIQAGVRLRHGRRGAPRPPLIGRNCSDCGEDLRNPHVLGAHLPDCTKDYLFA